MQETENNSSGFPYERLKWHTHMKKRIPVFLVVLISWGNLNAQLTASIDDSTNLSCYESGDGSATVSISGGIEPYEILWDDDSLTTTPTITNLSAGRWYRVSVTDAVDSVATDSVMLSQPEEIVFELEGLKVIQCYGPQEGYLKISSDGGTGPHTYAWSGEVSSESDSIYNLSAGKYYFTVTDSVGCSLTDSLTLTEADRVQITFDSIFPNPCLGQQTGEIYITAAGGELPYDYAWTGPSGFSSTLQDITGLKEGMYSLDLTDARGCVYQRDTSIVDGDPISVFYSASEYGEFNLLCHGDASGSIRVDTVAGNGLDWRNYTYIWSGPGGYKAYAYEIENLAAGNYHLNVFDSVNCRSDVTVTLQEPPPITFHYDSVVSNPCIDDQNSAIYISLQNGTEPFSYNWTGPEGFTSSQQDITGLSKGRYEVTVTDDDGCQSASDTTLIQVDNIDMVVSVSQFGDYNVSCNGSDDGFIKIVSIPGYEDISGFIYYTTGPDGFTSPFRFMTTGVKAGDYHITVTDPQGCSGEKDLVLTEPPKVQTGTISGANRFVLDSNYTYTVSDESVSSIYTWSVEGGEIWSGQNSKSVEIEWRTEGTGRVKVVETDENGCTGDTVYLNTQFQIPAGIEQAAESLRIYPNPALHSLYIRGMDIPGGSVEFYSLLGKLVHRQDFSNEISLDALDRGVYYLRVIDPSGQLLLTRKIIKK